MSTTDLRKGLSRLHRGSNARDLPRMAEFASDTITFNGEPVSRDDYVAALQQAMDSVQNLVWRLDDLIGFGRPGCLETSQRAAKRIRTYAAHPDAVTS